MTLEVLIPVDGCWVRRSDKTGGLGLIVRHRENADRVEMKVSWNSSDQEWLPLSALKSGFQPGWSVQDVPFSATRKSLGQGRIIGRRELGGREQLLVQLDADGCSPDVARERLRNRCRARQIPYIKIGRLYRFRPKDIATLIEESIVPATKRVT